MITTDEFKWAIISYHPGEQLWRLRETYSYEDKEKDYKITVEVDSRYDLSSVPRPFWKIVSPFELSNEAPLIHDFLYVTQGGKIPDPKERITGKIEDLETGEKRYYTRKEADRLFRHMMREASVVPWRRFLGYWAVRLAGWIFWRDYQ